MRDRAAEGRSDLGYDGPTPELAVPDAHRLDGSDPSAACLLSSVLYAPSAWDLSMVICEAAVGDQCTAATFCSADAGWHLCTANEYRARGGASSGWNGFGWIAGCIRTGGASFAPRDGLCSGDCAPKSAQLRNLGFSCSDGSASWLMGDGVVGMTTASRCWRVGENQDVAAAYWRPSRVGLYGDGAVCCR